MAPRHSLFFHFCGDLILSTIILLSHTPFPTSVRQTLHDLTLEIDSRRKLSPVRLRRQSPSPLAIRTFKTIHYHFGIANKSEFQEQKMHSTAPETNFAEF